MAGLYMAGSSHYALFIYFFELVPFDGSEPARVPLLPLCTVDSFKYQPLYDDPGYLLVCHGFR